MEPLEERMLLDAGPLNPQGAEVILDASSAPTIIVEGDDTIAEGAEYSLTLGEITDPEGDTVTEWIVHWGDGEIDTYDTGGEKTHTYTDDDPSGTASDPYTITVDLSDEDGTHAGAGGKEITVTNVAPSVQVLGPPILRPEGTEFTLTAGITDPGSADTFTYAWTMTRDGSTYPAQSDADFRFTPDDSGDYEVTLTVTDDDGGVGTKTAAVSVVNVAPTIALAGDDAVDEGTTYTLTLGPITDPGEDTVTQWIVHWGDGQMETYPAGGDKTHVYADDGAYTITVDLADEDGTFSGAGGKTLAVDNVAPTVEIIGAPASSPEGSEISFDSNIADSGSTDTHTYAWAVSKDGNPYASGTDSDFAFTPDDDGSFEITLRVTDDDGGIGVQTASITVTDVAPTAVILGAPASIGVDVQITLTAEITDPSTVDMHTLEWTVSVEGNQFANGGGEQFAFTPVRPGVYEVILRVTDDDGHQAAPASASIAVVETDLGAVDFLRLDHLDLSEGKLFYRLTTTNTGFLTLEVIAPEPSKSVRLKLYDQSPLENAGVAPLKTSILAGDNQRIDWPTSAGTVYYVEVDGANVDFDIRVANLLHHDAANGIVTVHGTEADDTFEFDASASRDVTINGVRYGFEDAEVNAVTFDGGQGYDIVELRNSPGDDTLEAWPNMVVLSNGPNDATLDFNVEATGFEDLQAYAVGGGNDTAILHGSSGNDKLKSYLSPADDFVRLRAKDLSYSLRAKFYAVVAGDAGASGADTAIFAGSEGADTFRFTGSDNTARMQRAGRDHAATAFDRVIARAGQGDADVAYFTDMPGEGLRVDGVFYFKPHKTKLVGRTVTVTARAFDVVHSEDNQDGFGVARMYDTSEDDHFEFIGNTARVYRRTGNELDLLYEAIGFDRVKAYRSTGDDTKDDASHAFGDELYLYGWDV